jgi:hypothetical protein
MILALSAAATSTGNHCHGHRRCNCLLRGHLFYCLVSSVAPATQATPVVGRNIRRDAQLVGPERRQSVWQLAWGGEGRFDSRRRVNSTVGCLAFDLRIRLRSAATNIEVSVLKD